MAAQSYGSAPPRIGKTTKGASKPSAPMPKPVARKGNSRGK